MAAEVTAMRLKKTSRQPDRTDLYYNSLTTINAAYTLNLILLHLHFKITGIKSIADFKLKSQGNLSDSLKSIICFYYRHFK